MYVIEAGWPGSGFYFEIGRNMPALKYFAGSYPAVHRSFSESMLSDAVLAAIAPNRRGKLRYGGVANFAILQPGASNRAFTGNRSPCSYKISDFFQCRQRNHRQVIQR